MNKVKIQEIAEEAGLSNAELIAKSKELGLDVKTANSMISLDEAGILVDYAISGILPQNWRKDKKKKLKSSYKSAVGIKYKTPKKTKWAGITIVGKKAKIDLDNREKVTSQKTKSSKKSTSAAKPQKKKKQKKSETSRSFKKILDSFEDLQVKEVHKSSAAIVNKNYTPSERLALKNGFEEVIDPSAYNGRYFIKNKKIWIHDIAALKERLGVSTDQTVRSLGYDVDTYYAVNTRKRRSRNTYRALRMCDTKDGAGDCRYNLNDMVYMSDGVYIHQDDCWW